MTSWLRVRIADAGVTRRGVAEVRRHASNEHLQTGEFLERYRPSGLCGATAELKQGI